MDGSWPGIIVALIAVGGSIYAARTARRTTVQTTPSAADVKDQQQYDQLQEDLKELRSEFARYKAARAEELDGLRFQLSHQMRLVRHLDDEIVELRQSVASGKVPPLLPRPPWPVMPGEVTVAT